MCVFLGLRATYLMTTCSDEIQRNSSVPFRVIHTKDENYKDKEKMVLWIIIQAQVN